MRVETMLLMIDGPSFIGEMWAICGVLRSGPLSNARLNHAGARIDHLGRRVHGLGWIHDHEIGACLTAAVAELMRARGLTETERGESVQEALRQLEMALALSEEGLRPQRAASTTELTPQEEPMTNEHEQYRRPVAVAPESAAGRLVIVCDDGSIWKWFHDGNRWEELAPVPGSLRAAAGTPPPRDG